ncbi:MAG: GtrA family protein [Burkholderiaceae bacterium]
MTTALPWFLLVGVAAALTHMGVFIVTESAIWPELANALGFAVAFCVSFAGHRLLSFRDTSTSLLQSLGRFAATAVVGFISNELVFIVLLRLWGWPSILALLLALILAAGQTFVLSRYWAFRR